MSDHTNDLFTSRQQIVSQNYDNINVQNSNAVFGNVDNSVNHHYHLTAPDQSSIATSRKRRRESESDGSTSKQVKEDRSVLDTLIQSLSFDGIWQRHNDIVTAHRGTCSWILSQDEDADLISTERDAHTEEKLAFSRWLESDEDYFWIRGVAGSGKSTLVNYIIQNEVEVKAKLRAWAGTQNVVFASFFFWRYGSLMQKSINGMLRTLLLQIVQQDTSVIRSLTDNGPDLQQFWPLSSITQSDRPWSQAQLKLALHKAIECSRSKFCFFIDALDEFHGYDVQCEINPHEVALRESVDSLLENIRGLWGMQNVKVCMASRPGNIFDWAFTTQVLNLNQLNERDIHTYAYARLGPWASTHKTETLTQTLIQRSQGIFLWVKLAVDSLVNGMVDGDTPDDLDDRLDELPAGLEFMYHHMLQKLLPRHRVDAMMLFNLKNCLTCHLSYFSAPSALLIFLCRMSFHTTQSKDASEISPTYISQVLDSRSCGLLQLTRNPWFKKPKFSRYNDIEEWLQNLVALDLTFIHRTAQDFVRKNLVSCTSKPGTHDNKSVEHPVDYSISMVEGSLLYLELFHSYPTKNMYHETFVSKVSSPGFPASSFQVYFLCLQLLSKMQPSLGIIDTNKYLDRLASIPLIIVNPALLHRFGLEDQQNPNKHTSYLRWLGHVSHFATHGFEEYTIGRSLDSDLEQPAVISYLLYLALLWLTQELSKASRLAIWIKRLQLMLQQLAGGDMYIRNVWRTILADLSGRLRFALPLENYAILLDACGSSSIPLEDSICMYMDFGDNLYRDRCVWQLSIPLGTLLYHDRVSTATFGSWRKSRCVASPEASAKVFREFAASNDWPRGFTIDRCRDPWLQIDFPVSPEQSEWITNGNASIVPAFFEDTYARYFKLQMVMLFCLAQQSGSLSSDVTWTIYVQRAQKICEPNYHMLAREFKRSTCSPTSCSICARVDSDQTGQLSFHRQMGEGHQGSLYNKPCPPNACWNCECVEYQRCGLGTQCKCLAVKLEQPGFGDKISCSLLCNGCSCIRKIHNMWLRQVLREDELDWHGWYDLLLEKYGLREKNLYAVLEEQRERKDLH